MMPCEAIGMPSPIYTWYYNGGHLQIDDATHMLLLQSGGLYFSGVRIADSGHYTCRADNAYGSVSADAYLSVVKGKECQI